MKKLITKEDLSLALAKLRGGLNNKADKGEKLYFCRTKISSFSNGIARIPYSDFGYSSRPNALMLTPQSQYWVIMSYAFDDSTSQVVLKAYNYNGTAFSGNLRYCYLIPFNEYT